ESKEVSVFGWRDLSGSGSARRAVTFPLTALAGGNIVTPRFQFTEARSPMPTGEVRPPRPASPPPFAPRRRRIQMSTSTFRRLALVLAVLLASAAGLQAQSSTGRISGTVVDSSGAVLPGATVTITQDQTGLSKTAVTDKDGAYLF